jgi:hypothetical protein
MRFHLTGATAPAIEWDPRQLAGWKQRRTRRANPALVRLKLIQSQLNYTPSGVNHLAGIQRRGSGFGGDVATARGANDPQATEVNPSVVVSADENQI